MTVGVREVVLVIMACASDGSSCEEHRVPAYEVMSVPACMASSLAPVMEWMERHPGLVLDHWRCEPREGGG
jgi:hypothetical protein